MSSPRLEAAYVAQVAAVRARVEAFALSRFRAGQHRDGDLERFLTQVVPVVLAGRRQVSALTDAYLAQLLSVTLGRRVAPRGPIDTDLLRGVDVREVYSRPFVSVRTELAQGATYAAAVRAGSKRLTDIALSDMQLAKTHTARSVLSSTSGVTGYERTLTGSTNCGLCVVASTQRYHKGDLSPIHPGCNCGVEPITEPIDGRVIHPERLEAAHSAIEERFGDSSRDARTALDYRKALLVEEHGELGPVLTVKSHRFTGPDDI